MNLKKNLITTLGAFAFCASIAQAAPSMNWSAYYEGYYLYNLNSPETSSGTDENLGRNNDRVHNAFVTSLAEIGLSGQATKEVSYFVEAGYGELNDTAYGDDSNRDILNQAYLSFALPTLNGITFDFGRFYSHMGRESFKASQNWNYSQSLTFKYANPTWHEGLRVHFINKSDFSLSAFIYNGWDTENDKNDSKTIGTKARFSPNKTTQLTYNLITGAENGTKESDYRTVHNFVAELNPSSDVGFAGEITLGNEKKAPTNSGAKSSDWMAFSVSAKKALNDQSYFAGRIEHFDDENGYRTSSNTDVKINSLTATYGYSHSKELETRYELRHDDADEDVFREDSTDFDDSQTTLLVSLLFTI